MPNNLVPTFVRPPAKEKVAETQKWAAETHTRIVQGLRSSRVQLWDVARELHEWDARRGWLWMGDGHDYRNLSDWLADPDVSMTRGTYYRLRDAWRGLVIERGIDANRVRQLDTSKVDRVMKYIRGSRVQVDDALSDVESSGWRELRERYPANTQDGVSSARHEMEVEDGSEAFADDVADPSAKVIEASAVIESELNPQDEADIHAEAEEHGYMSAMTLTRHGEHMRVFLNECKIGLDQRLGRNGVP